MRGLARLSRKAFNSRCVDGINGAPDFFYCTSRHFRLFSG
jgi:hypothetical protein